MKQRLAADAVVVRRHFDHPPARVFAAWTDASGMARWLSPRGQAIVDADVRVGGRFRVRMIGEGTEIDHTGVYIDVAPPRRLVFTWRSPYTGDEDSLVTVELEPAGAGTDLTLRHERLPAEHAAAHAGGWGTILGLLADELARAGRTP